LLVGCPFTSLTAVDTQTGPVTLRGLTLHLSCQNTIVC